ncbi:sulfate adenylyltransferase subunit 1 [Christiangramia sabulilitoris]|uniref:sulfate adenylyltransferase n=1 Tax=Christiangramia sabulilitoris TaxID=2583991 RepID=A0A550HZG8_9FLAO|nr:GTP-binding protein [Christiangramia sabulilitoris]TRO64095.1 sulfate adenylyltransferase [Christiangramia sabulilitoris]
MEVLKIATAGSVDDGKSTLIGRLLYDTKSLTSDKIEAIDRVSKKNGLDYLDFSLATDGLVAEREQGITIDVAHIYFSTPKKSYIIADTPGHIEYTRNMVTGASTSQTSIILIDARKGVIEQTYRHFFINNLLRIKEVIVAVNKMDLVNYSEEVFNEIVQDFEELRAKSDFKDQKITFIPVSALWGENIAEKSTAMPWYNGQTILEHLEALKAEDFEEQSQARFSVQTVIRPKTDEFHDYRGYAGKISGNSFRIGDEITVLPSLTTSTIKDIQFFTESFNEAPAGSSVTISLADDINVARGDMLVKSNEVPQETKVLDAMVCWMDNKALVPGTKYVLQHNTNGILAKIDKVEGHVDTNFGAEEEVSSLSLNDIGSVKIKLSKPIFADSYHDNRANGRFILVDTLTNTTAGVGFIK